MRVYSSLCLMIDDTIMNDNTIINYGGAGLVVRASDSGARG